MSKWMMVAVILSVCFIPVRFVYAAGTILYVPIDDRPVSLDYTVQTAQAANLTVLTPPLQYLSGRDRKGDPEKLWQWVLDNCQQADRLVLSADSLIYGGLVDSRVHNLNLDTLQERLHRFQMVKERNPVSRMYVYSTIMRSPRMSSGGVEPSYYETYGPAIFDLTALQDKAAVKALSAGERRRLEADRAVIPAGDLEDWLSRRGKNLQVNADIIDMAKTGIFDYVVMGRDDSAPYSQSNLEWRSLRQSAAGLPPSVFEAFPGADQLGMVLVARSYNDLTGQLPFVRVDYASGKGGATIPLYEDQPIGGTIAAHVIAAGGIVLANPQVPDLVLTVNTPGDGVTREANSPQNQAVDNRPARTLTDRIQAELAQGRTLAIADIAFANGADNALMNQLMKQKLLDRVSAYSGWNTASNTIGYSVAQGMMARGMTNYSRQQLLAVRYLDDWAYQANIRSQMQQYVSQANINGQYLNQYKALVTTEMEERERLFAQQNLAIAPEKLQVSFPWNRLFEIKVELEP